MKTTTDLRFGGVYDILDLIEPSGEKVQFLNLMNTPNGGASLLALKAGQALDSHAAPGELLVYVLEGDIEFTYEGNTSMIHGGQILMLGQGVPHAVKCTRDAKILLCKVAP